MILLMLLLTGAVPVVVSETPDFVEVDQHPSDSIAHPQIWPEGGIFNNIGSYRGLTPPPPPTPVLQASQAQKPPLTYDYPSGTLPRSRKKRKKQKRKDNIFLNDPANNFPERPEIPQEPDIPEEDEVEIAGKAIPENIPLSPIPDTDEGGTVYKHISVHVPPEDLDEEVSAPRVIKVARDPEKHLKVILIKPDSAPPPKTEVELPPSPLQRTLVYVISSSLGIPPPIKLVKPTPSKPTPPQVYFLRYTHKPTSAPPPQKEPELPEGPPEQPPPVQPPIKQIAIPKKNAELKSPSPTVIAATAQQIQPNPHVVQPHHQLHQQIPSALHILSPPVLYTPQTSYKIVPTRYQSPSSLSHLANNINNHQFSSHPYHHHHHHHPTSQRLVVPQARLHAHHYFTNPYQLYQPTVPTSSHNHFPLYYHGTHSHAHHHRSSSPQYFPVVNTRFVYSCTLFERR